MRALFGIAVALGLSGCAVTSAVLGQSGTIGVIYYAPAWGPDEKGEEVAYFLKQVDIEAPAHGENRIYFCSIKPDGSQRREIAQLWKDQPDQWFEPYATAVTMDINAATKRAAIGVEQGNRSGVFIVDLDGKNFKPLWPKEWNEDRPKTAGYPTWSPDGKWIAFEEYRFEGGTNLYRIAKMRGDASGYTPLTDRDKCNMQPAWSPKGDEIAYVNYPRYYPGPSYLSLTNPDGSEKRVTKQWGDYPRWSPDGQQILLEGTWVIDAGGAKVRNWHPFGIFPKWGKGGFVSVGPLDINISDPEGKFSRYIMKNVSRRGTASDLVKESFRW
ncbi:MAG TPA: hypothetical protein VMP11_13100 [Verrucomicrobiae bacterium]|nr:hypothetical protein [Verrucomicrobiae bacterium]